MDVANLHSSAGWEDPQGGTGYANVNRLRHLSALVIARLLLAIVAFLSDSSLAVKLTGEDIRFESAREPQSFGGYDAVFGYGKKGRAELSFIVERPASFGAEQSTDSDLNPSAGVMLCPATNPRRSDGWNLKQKSKEPFGDPGPFCEDIRDSLGRDVVAGFYGNCFASQLNWTQPQVSIGGADDDNCQSNQLSPGLKVLSFVSCSNERVENISVYLSSGHLTNNCGRSELGVEEFLILVVSGALFGLYCTLTALYIFSLVRHRPTAIRAVTLLQASLVGVGITSAFYVGLISAYHLHVLVTGRRSFFALEGALLSQLSALFLLQWSAVVAARGDDVLGVNWTRQLRRKCVHHGAVVLIASGACLAQLFHADERAWTVYAFYLLFQLILVKIVQFRSRLAGASLVRYLLLIDRCNIRMESTPAWQQMQHFRTFPVVFAVWAASKTVQLGLLDLVAPDQLVALFAFTEASNVILWTFLLVRFRGWYPSPFVSEFRTCPASQLSGLARDTAWNPLMPLPAPEPIRTRTANQQADNREVDPSLSPLKSVQEHIAVQHPGRTRSEAILNVSLGYAIKTQMGDEP